MKLVFYSVVLNHHQAPVADEFYKLLGAEYCFVELIYLGDNKGGGDYSTRPYLLRAWESPANYRKAMELARTADCCVFSGVDSLPYMKERLRLGLLSFDMSERWLKKGWKNLFSPAIRKQFLNYHLLGWNRKPLYKLCMSAYAKCDHEKLVMYKRRCFKWGYFTSVRSYENDNPNEKYLESETIKIMWCGRFLKLKHPELPILMSERLKREGYSFILDYFGDGPLREELELKAESLGLKVCKAADSLNSKHSTLSYDIVFHGAVPNVQVLQAMHEHDIFLFTSNRLEGWGAVVNEAMSQGCTIVGSDAIGSIPYLVEDGVNGFSFKSEDLDSLYEKTKWLLDHPSECKKMGQRSIEKMQTLWSPKKAAENLLQLIIDLKAGKETSIKEGPCSKD